MSGELIEYYTNVSIQFKSLGLIEILRAVIWGNERRGVGRYILSEMIDDVCVGSVSVFFSPVHV